MPIIPDPPLSSYEPHFHGGIWSIHLWAVNGEPIFGRAETANLLRSVLGDVRRRVPFQLSGFVILPDQVGLLLGRKPEEGVGDLVNQLLHLYRRDYAVLMGNPQPALVWDSRRTVQPVTSVGAFAHRLDAIHYAPVQAGRVTRPEDWGQSSYGSWVEQGLYKLGWGWEMPGRLVKMGRR